MPQAYTLVWSSLEASMRTGWLAGLGVFGTAFMCGGGTTAPGSVAEALLPALLDGESIKRARSCEVLSAQLEEFQAGKPFIVKEESYACQVVSKNGDPKQRSFGGFVLARYAQCEELRQSLEWNVNRYQNNLAVKIELSCDNEGKPTLIPDASVELAARITLRTRLPDAVERVNMGRIGPSISDCYFGVKDQMISLSEQVRNHRCTVMTSDTDVANVTYDAIWMRAALNDAYHKYAADNAETLQELQESDQVTVFFENFTQEQKASACAEQTETSLEDLVLASEVANATCM
jgi:hypothetical protein